MAKLFADFNNCSVIISGHDGRRIAETTVTDHNEKMMSIWVKEQLKGVKAGERVNVLIIHPSGVRQFEGTLSGGVNGEYGILLFGEKDRSSREAKRVTLNAPATISKVISPTSLPISEPMWATVENISSNGAMVKSQVMRFQIGSILYVDVTIGGQETTLYLKIVREVQNADRSYSFGCQMVFLQ